MFAAVIVSPRRLQIDRKIHNLPVIDENGGGPGVRLPKRHQKKG
jgi:hypothetical protein